MRIPTAFVSDQQALAEAPAALILLHGFGSNERDLAGIAPAFGLPWASLRAPIDMPHGGAAWFPIVTPGNPAPEPVAEATDAIWSWIDENLSANASVVAVGFSQGGLMASQLLRTRPDRVAATVILGGFVQAARQPGNAALAASRPGVFWGRGAEDRVIADAAVERTIAWLQTHATATAATYPGLGHGISREQLADAAEYVRGQLEPAEPAA